MNKRSHLVVLAVGATLALASTAQGSSSMPAYVYAGHHSTTKSQKAAHLRAQRQARERAFWRAHYGLGGVAPGGVYTPGEPAAATPGDTGATGNTGTPCGYGDWCP
jgi:hypothetical protein